MAQLARHAPLIPRARNFWGYLSPDIKSKLQAVLQNPSQASWNDAYTIVLDSRPNSRLTLWQAVIRIDPTFPDRSPCEDMNGNVLEEWSRIPTEAMIARAILLVSDSAQQH